VTRRVDARRAPPARDPYGLGPVVGYIGPAIAVVALVVIAIVTLGLMRGELPFKTGSGSGTAGVAGPNVTPAPSNVVITEPAVTFPGSIVYAKSGNIWIQTGTAARQLTDGGNDSMPAFSADGNWVYFIRINEGRGKFPADGNGQRTWYDLSTPLLMRTRPDGSASPQKVVTGLYRNGNSTWFYWLRQPTPSPDGKSITVISDGPNPLQSDVVLQSFDLKTKTLTRLNVPESLHLGQQDPAWRPDGRALLFVKNGRQLTRGAPQIYRYDPKTKKARAITGPGYIEPSYSPDGAFVAATKTDSFGSDVVILNANGTELLRVSDDSHSFAPAWSPAGNAIAFLHLQGTIVDLRMATLDASSGQWTVTKTTDLTIVSGLDGASRPSWFVPASELPAPTPVPSTAVPPSAAAASGSTVP
jgi:dipeptidyl aminopeptidase/acylaminoacyl peptidase